jgi:chromosome partitioning protein
MPCIPPVSPRCARLLDVLQFPEDWSGSRELEESWFDVPEKHPAMPVVAVINRKGGSGKSTLATHLAGYCANAGAAVILGDVDRQLSTQIWLRQRKTRQLGHAKEIRGWSIDPKSFVRPPAGIEHVIVDTPGGLRGFDLARVVMYADAILIPVCNSIFDRESAAECLAELRALPRVATGRCKLAAVGMRLDARTKSAEVLQAWATSLSVPFIAVLRESQAYVRCIEKGLSVFDLPASQVQTDLAQWEPILDWLQPIMQPAHRAADDMQRTPARLHATTSSAVNGATTQEPAQRALEPISPERQRAPSPPKQPAIAVSTLRRLRDALPIPRFLQRTP